MKKHQPPKWIIAFIKWYSHSDFTSEILGDLEEMYLKWINHRGLFFAKILYLWNAILFVRSYNNRFILNSSKLNQITMIKHAIKLSLRNIRKHKVYNVGNMLGLAIGISISLMIFIHVSQELSYEKAYPKNERIFRVSSHNEWAKSPPLMAQGLSDFFPELKKVCRFARYGDNTSVISSNQNQFISGEVFQTDQSTIEIFDLQFLEGNSIGSLERPYTVIINETTSRKLFGNKNPIGQALEVNEQKKKFEITGVIKDFPKTSHLRPEVLISMPTFYAQIPENWTNSRGWMVMYTYALIDKKENIAGFQNRMSDFMRHFLQEERRVEGMIANGNYFEIMPLRDIHLKSNRTQEMRANSSTTHIYVFTTLAFFIIIIACVNFINIFTTLAFKRLKEVGLRKLVGASRSQLILQLLLESSTIAVIASIIGLAICLISLPYYNNIVDFTMTVSDLLQPNNLAIIFGLSIVLGLLSGFYPALIVTQHKLTESILSNSNPKASISLFRKGLIVFQFSLSLFILISTLVVNRQMNFIQSKDLGYETDQLVTAKIYGKLEREIQKNHRSFFSSLQENVNIKNVSMASNLMGEPLSVEYFTPASADPEEDFGSTNMIWTDEHYLQTMGIEILQGRDFRAKKDTSITFLVSEQLAKSWNFEVVGTMGKFRDETGPIVGVFKDINYYSLHNQIEPLVICLRPSWANNLFFKINGENAIETMSYIESKMKEKSSKAIAQFNFVNDNLKQLYKSENNMFSAFKIFSMLAVIISCLGLLGMAAIEVQRRTKEVGIRKVLGASANQILILLSTKFAKMLALAIIIGIPLSYITAEKWLEDYNYHISLTGWDFIVPSIGLIIISLLIVTLHSFKIMISNPTESLRNE